MCRVQAQVNGTKIQLWDCHNGANQVWLRGAGNSLRPAHAPSKAMDIKDAYWGAFDGQDTHLWDGQNSGSKLVLEVMF